MRFPFCFCLFLSMLHFTDGCHVLGHSEFKEVTGYTGGSVLLPCSCSDPLSTVETFNWNHYYKREDQWTEVFQDKKYKNRLKLFNQSSPANLSLLISDLRKEDEGDYNCYTSQTYTYVRVTIKGCDLDQNKPAAEITGYSGESVVLPCSCTELQAKPEQLTWTFTAPNKNSEEIYPHEQSERVTGRVRLLNEISPGNLSLQISNLTKEDQGEYRCSVSSQQHINIRLCVQEELYFQLICLLTHKPAKHREESTTTQHTGGITRKQPQILH
ncbi:cell surface A33 antigen-like [Carassius carassius]|uniref:cell surface A33 antigen-like n=1 Tax=Carassius carassius TaxID=217509 RepID=UPI0028684F49|nr:cell surface A33 antigen-like [Carassius carassius]XP_059386225.1 cell surface A33 antigen-like [Carassius carassius]